MHASVSFSPCSQTPCGQGAPPPVDALEEALLLALVAADDADDAVVDAAVVDAADVEEVEPVAADDEEVAVVEETALDVVPASALLVVAAPP